MRISEAFPSEFLKAADLQGRTVRATINVVEMKDIGGDHKPVIYFQGREKGLVLNKTNGSTISYAYGDDTDAWSGAPIELFPQSVPFNGQMVPAIRVRIPAEEAGSSKNGYVQQTAPRPPQPSAGQHYDERNPPPAMDDEIPF